MCKIKLNEAELGKRTSGKEILSIIKPLLNDKTKIPCKSLPIGSNAIKIILGTPIFGVEYRFNIYKENFSAEYFELWRTQNAATWYLDRIYLHLYHTDKQFREEKQYFCIHSDPEDTNTYKHLHLHINIANEPIPKSHIALADGNQGLIKKKEALFTAFNRAIKMVKIEILDRY